MELTPEMLTQLNTFTRRELTADEVYVFKVRLCDNEIDRDGERFSMEALGELRDLFVGKTGVFDHNPSGEKQNARIFSTELVTEPETRTSHGEPYTALCALAYMVRTEGNADLIREIDGGIKKEVSISCSAGAHVCSICGKDRRIAPCTHLPGQEYGGKVCHVVLGQITDAYEWSFVAVPAQRKAGVTKHYPEEKGCAREQELEQKLFHCQSLIERMEAETRRDIMQMQVCCGRAVSKALTHAMSRMDLPELLELRDELREQQVQETAPQLAPMETRTPAHERLADFCIR
ncbi:MAG: hypothetical protein IJ496_06995 [Ruminococcus sp.]|nr:hypothetical protein [Ruminococcus sp.]